MILTDWSTLVRPHITGMELINKSGNGLTGLLIH